MEVPGHLPRERKPNGKKQGGHGKDNKGHADKVEMDSLPLTRIEGEC